MAFARPLSDFRSSPAFALFEGGQEAGVEISFFAGEAPPGAGPSLHEHPYAEVFLVQEGEATFTVGDERFTVTGGHVVVVPPHTPHRLDNSGAGILRVVSIHLSGAVEQRDLSPRG